MWALTGLAGETGLAGDTGLFGVFGVFTVLGVFGVLTVFGVFGVLTVFTSPLEFEPCVPVDGVVVGVGAGVDVLATVTGSFSNDSIDATLTLEPLASWMLMAFADATAPPLSSPIPSTEAAPTAVHFFLASMMCIRFVSSRHVLAARCGPPLVIPIVVREYEMKQCSK